MYLLYLVQLCNVVRTSAHVIVIMCVSCVVKRISSEHGDPCE